MLIIIARTQRALSVAAREPSRDKFPMIIFSILDGNDFRGECALNVACGLYPIVTRVLANFRRLFYSLAHTYLIAGATSGQIRETQLL